MKNGKRPNRKQIEIIKSINLNAENWLVTKNLPGELHIVHRECNAERVIPWER